MTDEEWREWVRRPARLRARRRRGAGGCCRRARARRWRTCGSSTRRPPTAGRARSWPSGPRRRTSRSSATTSPAGACSRRRRCSCGTPVIVIGTEVAEHFFPSLDPIGRELRIGGRAVPGRSACWRNRGRCSASRSTGSRWRRTPRRSRALTNPRGDIDGLVVQAPSARVLDDAMEEARGVMRGHPPAATVAAGQLRDGDVGGGAVVLRAAQAARWWPSGPRCRPSD